MSLSIHLRLAVTGSFLLLLSGCFGLSDNLKNLKEPEVALTSLKIKNANIFNPAFIVGLRLMNPNDLKIDLNGADVMLALNDKPVAKGLSQTPITLNSHGSSDLSVEVTADTVSAIQQVLSLTSKSSMNYEVKGHLHLVKWLGSLGQMPFSMKGTVDGQTLLSGAGKIQGLMGKSLQH